MTSRQGTSIRIFLVDGTPDGLRFVERSNWTGQAVVVSRSQYPEVRSRAEFASPGVYVLVGEDEELLTPMLYVGEGDDIRARLDQHVKHKDFWTKAVVFRSKDGTLNKAHVRHLESRLVELAKSADGWVLENSAMPQKPVLTEPEKADMESFLSDMLTIYPILGVDAFESPTRETNDSGLLTLAGPDASGNGYDRPEGFFVLAGSLARAEETQTFPDHAQKLRLLMIEKGVLVPKGDSHELTKDFTFNSPSLAAAFLLGKSANGRTEWKNSSGVTLKQIQDEAVSS